MYNIHYTYTCSDWFDTKVVIGGFTYFEFSLLNCMVDEDQGS